MKVKNLDGSNIDSIESFHDTIADLLEFPDCYGKNIDALWDCLTGYIDTEIQLVWTEHRKLKDHAPAEFEKILEVLVEMRADYPGFSFSLK